MKIFFLRLFFIVCILFFEFSFFDILFPWSSAPLIILVSIISWSLLIPFPRVFFSTLSLVLLFDIVSSGIPGPLTLYSVFLVYTTNFLSRRLLAEHYGKGITLYMFFAPLSIVGFDIFKFIFSQGNPLFWTKDTTFVLFISVVPSQNLLFSMIFSMPLFIMIYFIMSRFEKYMSHITRGEILGIR